MLHLRLFLLLLAFAPPPCPACADEAEGCQESCICALAEIIEVLALYAVENGVQELPLEHLVSFYEEKDQVFCKATKKVMRACLTNNRNCNFTFGNVSLSYESGVMDLKDRCGFEGSATRSPETAPIAARGLWIETILTVAATVWKIF